MDGERGQCSAGESGLLSLSVQGGEGTLHSGSGAAAAAGAEKEEREAEGGGGDGEEEKEMSSIIKGSNMCSYFRPVPQHRHK